MVLIWNDLARDVGFWTVAEAVLLYLSLASARS